MFFVEEMRTGVCEFLKFQCRTGRVRIFRREFCGKSLTNYFGFAICVEYGKAVLEFLS